MSRVFAITPTRHEAAYIKYLLASQGQTSMSAIARKIKVRASLVGNVCRGCLHSKKVEKAVASACGYADWNTMLRTIRGMNSGAGTLPAA